MKTIGLIILICTIILYVFMEYYKRKAFAIIHTNMENGRYIEVLTYLDHPIVQLIYPKFNRLYTKLNACLFLDDNVEIDYILDALFHTKMNHKQKCDVYIKAFNFYIERENQEQAAKVLQDIKNLEEEDLINESLRTYDIYMQQSYAYIDEMLLELQKAKGLKRITLEYQLHLQYESKGEFDLSEKYLQDSTKHLSRIQNQK